MKNFSIVTPKDLAHASRLLAQPGHLAIAGGVDVIDLLKLNLIAPETLVNLKGMAELDGIQADPKQGLSLGALVKLHDLAVHPAIRQTWTALSEAAAEAATEQIRNLGTVGGNLLQRPRCWYFRNADTPCLKKGGDKCFSLSGLNRYHAILGGGPSYIVHPSNLAPALIALGASARIIGPSGERTVELQKFFTLPSADPIRENDLKPGEIIAQVIVPAPAPGARSTYIEAREKQSFDWPLVSVAAVITPAAGSKSVRDARIVMGAVAPIPWRSPEAENAIKGAPLDVTRAKAAADAALKQAIPMSENAYKITLARVMVRRAILRAAGVAEV